MAFGDGAPVGNQYAAKKRKFEAMVLALIEADAADSLEGRRRLYKAANKMLDLAAEGERWAVELLRDTLDGKPKQSVEAVLSGVLHVTGSDLDEKT